VHAQIHDNACFSLFLSVLLIQFFLPGQQCSRFIYERVRCALCIPGMLYACILSGAARHGTIASVK
jgi:hypothetical protein